MCWGRLPEYMIQLCNIMGLSPWFSIHHQASDAYVREMAAMVKANLRPDLKVFLEHSNEVWNGMFPQGQYAQERGIALGLSSDPYVARYRYHARRSVEIFSIWKSVWGANSEVSLPPAEENQSAVNTTNDAPIPCPAFVKYS